MDLSSETKKSDSFFKGLCVRKKDTGLYAVEIGTGFFRPGEQKYPHWRSEYTYLNTDPTTSVDITTNKDTLPRFDYIVAKPDYTKQFDNFRGLRFYCKVGELRQDRLEEYVPEFPNNLDEDEILLAFIYNPSQGNSAESTISLLSVNNTDESFSYETQPSDFRNAIIKGLQEWQPHKFYIKQQIVNHNLSLWYCTKTHTSNIFRDDMQWYWEPISASGGLNEEEIINLIKEYTKPTPPLYSIQFNSDMSHFGGSPNLLWHDTLKELFLNGVIVLKKHTYDEHDEILSPLEGHIKLFLEEKDGLLCLKIKLENGEDYILTSLKSP